MNQRFIPSDVIPKFPLGNIVVTAHALSMIAPQELFAALGRHANCDWGEVNESGRQRNEEGFKYGARMLSAYRDPNGTEFWIITDAERRATTILLPDDY